MLRVVLFLIAIAIAATGLSWLADRPGSLLISWQGYEIEVSVFDAVIMLVLTIGVSILLWSIITAVWRSPASVGAFFNRRRQMRGLEALSGGMIAIGSGDRATALRYAVQARKALPNEPLTQLLRAQAAQLSGDRATSRRIFEAMLAQPETEQLGLRGLYLEAEREGEREAARQFAERSVDLNPRLPWAVDALFELQCKEADWAGALKTLGVAKKYNHHEKSVLDRRRAVVMTAWATALEESDPNRAMSLAIDAHNLAHDLVPAAALAGRMLAARGQTKRAIKVVERTWRRNPHPDLATVHAYARLGDSPRDRLDRVKRLAQHNPHSLETSIAIATAAIEAKDFDTARHALEPLDASRKTQRVCTLMARLESEAGNQGGVREWLARAVHAPRDPAWVADGVVAEKWAAVSPVTGTFDAFRWRVPVDALDAADGAVIAAKLEQMMKLGTDVVPAAAQPIGAASEVPAGASTRPAATLQAPSRQAEDAEAVTVRRPAATARSVQSMPSATAGRGSETSDGEARPGQAEAGKSGLAAVAAAVQAAMAKTEAAPAKPASREADVVVKKTPAIATVDGASVASGAGGAADRKPLEPAQFIAPRAPDDPGVKPREETAAERPKQPPLAVVSGKR